MELRDLYDSNRNLIGKTIKKGEEIPDNTYIMIVVIFIQNDNNEFLIQKRSLDKGGKWATTGGHPKAGESSFQGILTEAQEELGIQINNPILFKQMTGKNNICDLYYIKNNIDINKLNIQKEEVSDIKWASIDEINQLKNNNEFHEAHYQMFKECLNFLNKK